MTLKVGLIVGREWSFPPAFIEEVNRRDEGVVAEYVKLGAPHMDDPAEYAVIIDRISHEVPFYRTYLKQAALMGCAVVNNPFMWTADDKFFGAALATRLGIAHPKTVVLPNKEYIPGVVHEESLRNLQYPLDWQGIADYIGMPCILKDAHGGGWKDVYVCNSLDELIHHYDTSGLLTMIVQEFIEWDQFIRCICIGQDKVMPIKYDPGERKYHVEHDHLSPELGARVVADSLKLVRALGYDMNSMEWAVRDGIPYAIDFMNPAPDMDIYSLTPHYFEWAVQSMADMAISLAKNPRRQVRDLRWDALFTGSRETAAGGDDGTAGSASAGFAEGGQHGSGTGGRSASDEGGLGLGPGGRTASEEEGPIGSGSGGRVAAPGAAEASFDDGGVFGGSGNRTGGTGTPSAVDGPVGSGAGGVTGGGEDVGASAGTEAIRAEGGSVVDQSPMADLEPPAEAPAPLPSYSEPSESREGARSPGVLSGSGAPDVDAPSRGDAPSEAEEQR
jgi:hypothetical protein